MEVATGGGLDDFLVGFHVVEGFPGTVVGFLREGVEILFRVDGQVGAFGGVLSEQLGVLVGAAPPGAVGDREE